MADALCPGKSCNKCACRGHCGYKQGQMAELAAREEARAGIESGEPEGNYPAQKKLNISGINGHGIAAKRQQVLERRVHADAVFKPE
jgi:hypothetical protein